MELLKTHGVPLLIGAAIAIAVILVIVHRDTQSKETLSEASRLYFNARSAQDLTSIVQNYPTTPLAPLALVRLAKFHYDTGDFNNALTRYTEFLSKHPDHMMRDVAELGRVHCVEASGQVQAALDGFTAFAAKNPGSYLLPQAIIGQGRCLEQLGQWKSARAVYEDFVTAHPDSGWVPRVKELLDAVSRKLASDSYQKAALATTVTGKKDATPIQMAVPGPVIQAGPKAATPSVETSVEVPVKP
jgi:outer membrane protein assembly factor BamD (BamD/ComL family)